MCMPNRVSRYLSWLLLMVTPSINRCRLMGFVPCAVLRITRGPDCISYWMGVAKDLFDEASSRPAHICVLAALFKIISSVELRSATYQLAVEPLLMSLDNSGRPLGERGVEFLWNGRPRSEEILISRGFIIDFPAIFSIRPRRGHWDPSAVRQTSTNLALL